MNTENHKVDYVKKEIPSKIKKIGFVLTVIGLLFIILAYISNPVRSGFNNIILLMFLSSIGVGSLFLVALEYLAGSVWSTPFRRISEFMSATLIILPIVALPAYFYLHDLFHWTHVESLDELLQAKAGYLNIEFFSIRTIAFFAIWIVFFLFLIRNSFKQDKTFEQNLTKRNIKISAVFMPFFIFTVTFFSIDWIMSLEPHWFSTIFGVYYFSGTVLAALAILTLIVVPLNEKGYLVKGLVKDHYYSLGALMFAFTNFWAYIAFSQYLLIWYANLPEETFWFLQRWEGGWIYLSIGLILVRFLIPYIGLLSQPSKMNPKRLIKMSAWILFAHFFDLFWLIMPTYGKGEFVFGWIELGFPVFAAGVLIIIFTYFAGRFNLVPSGDPKLKRAIDFRL